MVHQLFATLSMWKCLLLILVGTLAVAASNDSDADVMNRGKKKAKYPRQAMTMFQQNIICFKI